MTREDKELLLKDLCARLPYGVKIKTRTGEPYMLKGLFDTEYGGLMCVLMPKHPCSFASPKTTNYTLDECKPYLFPMSSMTDEQKDFYWNHGIDFGDAWTEVDWLNKNHFDYRGLIPKGLALDATGLNIY